MTFKKSLIFLATATAIGLATGCSDDDNGGGGSNDGDDGSDDPVSFQQQFLDSDNASNIMEADPEIDYDGTFAAESGQAKLGSASQVGFAVANGSDNSFFDDTDYIGAVDPDASTPWWNEKEWTLHEGTGSLLAKDELRHPLWAEIADDTLAPATGVNGGDACADGAGEVSDGSDYPEKLTLGDGTDNADFPVCVISDDWDKDTTLTNDYAYVIDGIRHFGPQKADNEDEAQADDDQKKTLTIEEGTQTFGDTEDDSGLIITRNAKIDVQGTADLPVVMSSLEYEDGNYVEDLSGTDNNEYFSGINEWGGLVIDGYAPVNAGDESLTEVAPDGVNRYFGGDDAGDDSGSISHIVIAESGGEFRPDEEIQGLTLEGVGNATDIDHVQIHHSGDDGIEWFGGTVNAKYLLITGANDDSFDMDLGFQGGIQYALARQSEEWGNRTIESDNNGDNFDAEPITRPTYANLTLIGSSNDEVGTWGALHREGMAGHFHKVVMTDDEGYDEDYSEGCLDIDDTDARIEDGKLQYEDVIMNCANGAAVAADD